MQLISGKSKVSESNLNKMPGFDSELHRQACRLVLDLQEGQALHMVGDEITTAKTFLEVVEALSDAKVRLRLKKITSEVPKSD